MDDSATREEGAAPLHPARPPAGAAEVGPSTTAAEVLLAVPFDIDLELDIERLRRERPVPEKGPALTGRNAPLITHRAADIAVSLDGVEIARGAREEVWIYGFEVGLIIVRFRVERDLPRLADLGCDAERIELGGRNVYAYADARAAEVRASLRPFARETYEVLYQERDVYPIVILPPGPDTADASRLIRENEAAIVGIVGGEDDWARLSPWALQKSEIRNLGYYVDELIVVKEWGALVSSAFEQQLIVGLVLLAYAQRWALSSYNHLTNHRQNQALRLLAESRQLRPFLGFVGARPIREIASKLFEASEDRIALVAAIRDFTSIPELTSDWHLHNLYQELARTFYLNELYRVVASKNEELERAYAAVHDHLVQSRLASLELFMVVLIVLEGLLFFVWFLSEIPH
jgi:hypothetical protein